MFPLLPAQLPPPDIYYTGMNVNIHMSLGYKEFITQSLESTSRLKVADSPRGFSWLQIPI
jgi:hypothetical protein